MKHFHYVNQTEIFFGKEEYDSFITKISDNSNVILLVYGGGSIKRNGIYQKVIESLNKYGKKYIELSGIVANPRLTKVYEGIKLVKENSVDLILAVGGGSVIDTAKAVGLGSTNQEDIWNIYKGLNKSKLNDSLKVAVYLTIPAAGSENSTSSVIQNDEESLKLGLNHESFRPFASYLDPEVCLSLPLNQILFGTTDIFAHMFERFMTNEKSLLLDNLILAAMNSLMYHTLEVLKERNNLSSFKEIMLLGMIAHNDSLGYGRVGDWGCHGLEHPLSAILNLAHGEGLALTIPAWLKENKSEIKDRIRLLGKSLFGLSLTDSEDITINKLEMYFNEIGLKTRIPLDNETIERLCNIATLNNTKTIGNYIKLDYSKTKNIYELISKGEVK